MAYDELLADRTRQILNSKSINYEEKKMMGGLCFMVDGKMAVGMHFDKNREEDLLMCRIGPTAEETAMSRPGCIPMAFTGRPMKGYVHITPEGFDTDDDLEYWIKLCLDFNPLAKASKKKKAKS